jgi:glycerol-3-phosphate dehydrogenase
MPKVAIIGTGRWGRTLALMLAQNGLNVSLWARTEPEAQTLISSISYQFPG